MHSKMTGNSRSATRVNNNRNKRTCSRSRSRSRSSMCMSQPIHGDSRLHGLPVELLTRILSKLPTKDAAAMQLLSKRMRQAFTLLTNLEFDVSPVSQRPNTLYHIIRSPIFESFVDNTLRKFSEFGKPLKRFKLYLECDKSYHEHFLNRRRKCKTTTCYSHIKPTRLNMWLSYPLAYSGLKHLALSIQVSSPYEFELPAGIFTCQALESLNLSFNIEIDDNDFPIITLPNLKFLYLHSFTFTTAEFLTRLVNSCPVLEDLSIIHFTGRVLNRITISSPSLRKLALDIWYYLTDDDPIVVIDTPKLQYLKYDDYLAPSYSIVHMSALTEAHITIVTKLDWDDTDAGLQTHHSLIRTFAHVQHLSLLGYCVENVYFSGELKDQLPEFQVLKTLELGVFFHARWDVVLSLFLRRTPILETLTFPKGLCVDEDGEFICSGLSLDDRKAYQEEAKAWRSDETIPATCMSRLKRIQLNDCYQQNRELNMMRFFLRLAPVLKEVVVSVHDGFNPIAIQRQLELVPRASSSCSITAHTMTQKR